jgi:hypothetical protein
LTLPHLRVHLPVQHPLVHNESELLSGRQAGGQVRISLDAELARAIRPRRAFRFWYRCFVDPCNYLIEEGAAGNGSGLHTDIVTRPFPPEKVTKVLACAKIFIGTEVVAVPNRGARHILPNALLVPSPDMIAGDICALRTECSRVCKIL